MKKSTIKLRRNYLGKYYCVELSCCIDKDIDGLWYAFNEVDNTKASMGFVKLSDLKKELEMIIALQSENDY